MIFLIILKFSQHLRRCLILIACVLKIANENTETHPKTLSFFFSTYMQPAQIALLLILSQTEQSKLYSLFWSSPRYLFFPLSPLLSFLPCIHAQLSLSHCLPSFSTSPSSPPRPEPPPSLSRLLQHPKFFLSVKKSKNMNFLKMYGNVVVKYI